MIGLVMHAGGFIKPREGHLDGIQEADSLNHAIPGVQLSDNRADQLT